MRSLYRAALILATALSSAGVAAPAQVPTTPTETVRETLHGVEIADPYRWLEDQDSPVTRLWINRQNRYTRSLLGALPGREYLQRRLGELMKTDIVGMPVERNGSYFFRKRRADQDLFVIYRRKGLKGKDEVLIDPHPLSPDHTTSVGLRDVSRDGSLMAYAVREGGADETTLRLLDVNTRKALPDQLPRARYGGVSITNDKSGFYYDVHTDQGPRVYSHALGTDPSRDREIFGKGYGPGDGIGAGLSDDGHYLLMTVYHGSAAKKTEVYVQDVAGGGPIVPIVNDVDAEFEGEIGGDRLFLRTDWQAPNGRVFAVDLRDPARDHWREIIPARDDVIEGISLAGGKLFVNYLHDVQSRLAVFEPDGKHVRDISLPAIGSISGVDGRWDSQEAFFAFSSFHILPTTYRYDISHGTRAVWSHINVPIHEEKLQVEQVWYPSKDGTKVPMFLVHARGLIRDGARPTLLTGYGGFRVNMTPRFDPQAVIWADRGGVFALPNLRGGGEFGEAWHEAGMLVKKHHVFEEFIEAAEWLIKNAYTRSEKLAISGGSNGGLLVGAAMTQRPDLFQAVVCAYPLLDMLRYQKFLVARFWVPEYGSADDPEQFKVLYAYSPYQHVKPETRYPAVLFITGDADTRVAPLHARKMCALLQSATASDRPVLLHYDTKAGHSGGKPLSQVIDDESEELGFLFWQLGVTAPGG